MSNLLAKGIFSQNIISTLLVSGRFGTRSLVLALNTRIIIVALSVVKLRSNSAINFKNFSSLQIFFKIVGLVRK